MLITVVFRLTLLLCLQSLGINASALRVHRQLQSSYQTTSHNIRLDFSSDEPNTVFSQDVKVQLEEVATNILTNELGSDISLIDTTYAASIEKPTLYVNVQARHPSSLSPSITSLIILAFRENPSEFNELLSASEEYNDVKIAYVSSFRSFESLTDIEGSPTQKPTLLSVASRTIELSVPVRMSFETTAGTVLVSVNDSIIEVLTTLLSKHIDRDIQVVSISPIDRRRLKNSIHLPIVITVRHPIWMTSSYAQSLIMFALNDSISEIYGDEALLGISNISFDDSFNLEELMSAKPTHAPTSEPTASQPTRSSSTAPQTTGPTWSSSQTTQQLTDSFQITLSFVGISPDTKLDDDFETFVKDGITSILIQNLDSAIEIVEVLVEQYVSIPSRHRFLREWLGLNVILEYTINQKHSSDLSTKDILSSLEVNLGDITLELRNMEGFHDLKRIEVISTPSSGSDESGAHNDGPDTTSENILEKMPTWAWITIASCIGIIIITAVVVCFICSRTHKEKNVQELWTNGSPHHRDHVRRRRSRSRSRDRRSSRSPSSCRHARLHNRNHSHERHRPRSRSRQKALLLEPPPQHDHILALPCAPVPERVLALAPPPVVRRASSISDLPVSIYPEPEETRMVVHHQSNSHNLSRTKHKKEPDPVGLV